jgi:S-adenosylmethionine:tRNA ribosyltransferase-isomerase
VADANQHTMHTEMIAVTRETIHTLRDHAGRIVAVGTTSMRTLESLYYIGAQILAMASEAMDEHGMLTVGQFVPYTTHYTYSAYEVMDALLTYLDENNEDVLHAQTQIMIKPGYDFRVVDQLITNFHQPKSTLLLLVSAFVGSDWKKIYDYALAHDFRFLSYGDSSVLSRSR